MVASFFSTSAAVLTPITPPASVCGISGETIFMTTGKPMSAAIFSGSAAVGHALLRNRDAIGIATVALRRG
jgi:hypothetical protein